MTWIAAKRFVSGYVAMFSDVQVTWGNGAHRENCLRKVYAMAPNIACGFSGSVEVGFNLLADMRFFAEQKLKRKQMLLPRQFAFDWYRRGRNIFSDLPEPQKKLGCSLILSGYSPVETAGANTSLPRTDIIIMNSANGFTPKITNNWKIVSIGSGSAKKRYVRFLESLNEPKNSASIENSYGQPGRAGENMAFMASIMLKDNIEPGISPCLHFTLVDAFGVKSYPLNFTSLYGEKKIKHEMPKVAETYSDFKTIEKNIVGMSSEAIG